MKRYVTKTDGDGVVIGNNNFWIIIPHNASDGFIDVAICNLEEFGTIDEKILDEMNFHSTIAGNDIRLFDYDHAKEEHWKPSNEGVLAHLNGRYDCYSSSLNCTRPLVILVQLE